MPSAWVLACGLAMEEAHNMRGLVSLPGTPTRPDAHIQVATRIIPVLFFNGGESASKGIGKVQSGSRSFFAVELTIGNILRNH